jgi:hypothetical protein
MTPDRDVTQLHSRLYLDRRQLLHEATLSKTLLGANPPHPGKTDRHESSRASVCAVRSGVFGLRGSTFPRGVFCWFTEALSTWFFGLGLCSTSKFKGKYSLSVCSRLDVILDPSGQYRREIDAEFMEVSRDGVY